MANDLVNLFPKPKGDAPGAQVRQGVVEAWNPDTGDNTIRVAGGVLLNVPSLTGESVSLAAGDVALLLSMGSRWFLLGKVTTPGDPGTIPTWPADITALTGQVETINTVTIPAVQNDVTIVQGDVIELNTVTVPAVQASADAAQSTADTAQSTATTAQGTADSAATAAATAQGTANSAASAASTAQSAADAAQADADAAASAAAAAQSDVDAILPITETKISDNAITTPKINALAITAAKIAADAITAAKILAGSITGDRLTAGTITATQIAGGTITAAKIAAGTITATEIQAGAITGTKLSADAIDGKTITGSLIRTAASGQRIELNSSQDRVLFYSGEVGEDFPGSIFADVISSQFAATYIRSPSVSGSPLSQFYLGSRADLNQGSAQLSSDYINLSGLNSAIVLEANTSLHIDSAYDIHLNSDIDVEITGDNFRFNGATVMVVGGNPQPVSSFSATDITNVANTSFAAGTPVVGVAFTAPATGKVYIVTQAHMASSNTAGSYIYVSPEVRTGSTVGSGTVVHTAVTDEGVSTGQAGTEITRVNASTEILVTGLTPGNSYNVRLMHLITAGALGTIFYRAVLVKPVL